MKGLTFVIASTTHLCEVYYSSHSVTDNDHPEIHHLKQKLSQYEDERALLRERLNEVELEFRKTLDDRASTLTMYEEQLQSLVQERNAQVENHILESMEK